MIKFSLCVTSIIFLSPANGQSPPLKQFPPFSPADFGGSNSIDSAYQNNENDSESNISLFKQADVNNDGKVTFDEFLLNDREYVQQQERNFRDFDADGDGFVTQQEHDNFYKRRAEDEAESRRQREKLFRELIAGFDNYGNDKFGQYTSQTPFSVPPFFQGFSRSNASGTRLVDPPLVQPPPPDTTKYTSPSP